MKLGQPWWGLGKQALLMNPSERTPSPSPLSFWVSQPPPWKQLFVNSVAMTTRSRENSLFKVESEGDTWRNGSGGDNRQGPGLPAPPPLLLLEQGSGSPEMPPSCHSQSLWVCSRLPSLKGKARWLRLGGGGPAPPTHRFPDTDVHFSTPPRTAAHRFSYTSHECLPSPPA